MIVVMPNGSLPRPANLPRFTPGTHAVPRGRGPRWKPPRTGSPTSCSRTSSPSSRRHYRVLPGPEHRAIAGLSMGGGQTLRVLTTHPDEFAYVAIWSAGLFGGNAETFEKQNESVLERRRARSTRLIKLFSISVGDKDFALTGSKALAEVLEKHGIKHELHVSGGGHTWINWRHYLSELAPRLFR